MIRRDGFRARVRALNHIAVVAGSARQPKRCARAAAPTAERQAVEKGARGYRRLLVEVAAQGLLKESSCRDPRTGAEVGNSLHVERIPVAGIQGCCLCEVPSGSVESILAHERQTETMLKHVAFGVRERWRIWIGEQLLVDCGSVGRTIGGQCCTRLLPALFAASQPSLDRLASDAFDEITHDFLALWRRGESFGRRRVPLGHREVTRGKGGLGRVHGCEKDEIGGDLRCSLERLQSLAITPECEKRRAFIEGNRTGRGRRRAGPCRRERGKRFLVATGAETREPEHEVSGSSAGRHGDDFGSLSL